MITEYFLITILHFIARDSDKMIILSFSFIIVILNNKGGNQYLNLKLIITKKISNVRN